MLRLISTSVVLLVAFALFCASPTRADEDAADAPDCNEESNLEQKNVTETAETRDFGITFALIATGASLAGTASMTAVNSASTRTYKMEIHNLSKFFFRLEGCNGESGYFGRVPTFIAPGEKEGIHGQNAQAVAYGVLGACTFKFGIKEGQNLLMSYMVHVGYHASNWFGQYFCQESLCLKTMSRTSSVNNGYDQYAKWFYDISVGSEPEGMKRQNFNSNIGLLKQCIFGLCISSTMGSGNKPEIKTQIFPIVYANIAPKTLADMKKKKVTEAAYEQRMQDYFGEILATYKGKVAKATAAAAKAS